MKVFVYHEDQTLVLEEKEIPVCDVEKGAVVKIIACAICGTDIRTYRFGSGKIVDGCTIGHEMVGKIISLSHEYQKQFSVGDYISLAPAVGCGGCISCKASASNMCNHLKTIGFQYDGGFGEYMAIPAQALTMGNVYKLPKAKDYSVFTLSEPLACVINAQSYLHIQKSDDVLIIGGGIIGCLHAELAKNSGAHHVMLAETSKSRIGQLEELLNGVSLIDSSSGDIEKSVKEKTGGKGPDVVVVACSVGAAQAEGMKLLEKRGRISLFGGLAGETTGFLDSNLIHYKELSVYGVHASTPEQNKTAMELIASGVIDAGKYITKCYPLEQIKEAFYLAAKGDAMKIIICSGKE